MSQLVDLSNPSSFVTFVQTNPKKRGSAAADRYDRYKRARTIGEALTAGALVGDLKNDLGKGYLQPNRPAVSKDHQMLFGVPPQRPAPRGNERAAAAKQESQRPVPRGKASEPRSQSTSSHSFQNAGVGHVLGSASAGSGPRSHASHQSCLLRVDAKATVPPPASSHLGELRGGTLLQRIESRQKERQKIAPEATGTSSSMLQQNSGVVPMVGGSFSGGALSSNAPASLSSAVTNSQSRTLSPVRLHGKQPQAASEETHRKWECRLIAGTGEQSPITRRSGSPTTTHVSDTMPAVEALRPASGAGFLEDEPILLSPDSIANENVFVSAEVTTAGEHGSSPRVMGTTLSNDADVCPNNASAETDVEGETEVSDGEDTISLRLRLGMVVVKKEKDSSDEALAESEPQINVMECGQDAITLRLRLGVAWIKQEPADVSSINHYTEAAPSSPSGRNLEARQLQVGPQVTNLRSLFQQQRLVANSRSGDALGQRPAEHSQLGENSEIFRHQQEQQDQQQATEQLEAAQIASYDSNVTERQSREAKDRELLQQGSLEPLETLDPELMTSFMCTEGMLCWLESAENRNLLFRYLELRARAIRWYQGPAESYFEKKQLQVTELLEKEDVAEHMSKFLHAETERVEAEMFDMPEKGSFVPRIFAPATHALDMSACVELD